MGKNGCLKNKSILIEANFMNDIKEVKLVETIFFGTSPFENVVTNSLPHKVL